MTRTPQPRFIADVRLVVEISGVTSEEAERRLEAVLDFLQDRVSRSTFTRLAGQPRVEHFPDVISDVVPT